MKPIPTACIAKSEPMPNKEQAIGINSKLPPATPEAPQAANVDKTLKIKAVAKSTLIPKVWAIAKVKTVIVTAAPSILIVAPKGIETEYISSSNKSFSHKAILTGILAAELRVKKAMIPLSFKQRKTSGYGFLLK